MRDFKRRTRETGSVMIEGGALVAENVEEKGRGGREGNKRM